MTRLSPSSTTTSRRGSFSRDSTAPAATASGGETIAPSAKQAAQGKPGASSFAAQATATVVNTTQPTACSRIGRRLARNSCQSVKKALDMSSGGRNSVSTRSGSSLSAGTPGSSASTMPPTT